VVGEIFLAEVVTDYLLPQKMALLTKVAAVVVALKQETHQAVLE
jgi:hypothetical protein